MNEELIRKQLYFAGLSDADIAWLLQMGELVSLRKGEVVIEEGAPGDALYMILDGECIVTKLSGNSQVVIAVRGPSEILGELALLEQTPRSASVSALTDCKLYRIPVDTFFTLITTHPSAILSILKTVISRLRTTETMLQQSEKMASLGALAAGLAHELNNPAAAVQRSSDQLQKALAEWQNLTLSLNTLALHPRQMAIVERLRDELGQVVHLSSNRDPLAVSDSEGVLEAWLAEQGIERGWEVAPALAAQGWTAREMAEIGAHFDKPQLSVVLRWLCAGRSLNMLQAEMQSSSERISEIVKTVKSYAFLDQAPIQSINIHEGLEDTLVILRSKLGPGVRLVRDYAQDIPKIEAYGSELNQAWTNILDNAIETLRGQGELRIITRLGEQLVSVEVVCAESGSVPVVQTPNNDPLSSTSVLVEKMGRGLNLASDIIQKHRGQIRVIPNPGVTTVRVLLPPRLLVT